MDNLPVIAIRFALYADLMVLAGMTAFSLYGLRGVERSSGILPLARPAIVLALFGLVLSGLGMLALAASMIGSSVWAVDGETLGAIISESAIGTAWLVRMAAMFLAVIAAMVLRRNPVAGGIALLAATSIAIATLVWTGHAGATEGWTGTAHRISDIIHMLAAAVWIGGLAAFAWILYRPLNGGLRVYLPVAHRALEQFSRIGTLAVGALIATGIVNSLAVIGISQLSQLAQNDYAKLLGVKLLLFAAMLALAAFNRWRLTPALGIGIADGSPAAAVASLRRSLLFESSAALAILALVAWLGTLEPLANSG